MTSAFLLDNSAWARINNLAVPQERVDQVSAAIRVGAVWSSIILLLEAGYSATDAASHARMMDELGMLSRAELDVVITDRAVDLQRQLAGLGHHRVPPVDVLTAAIAEKYGLTVLHYDKDYDVICEKSDCAAATEWIAPRGSV